MRHVPLALLVLALGVLAQGARADDAPAQDTSKSTIDQLDLGTYWWGAEITKDDLRGKVVLWEIWGS